MDRERRTLLKSLLGAPLLTRFSWAVDLPTDVKVTRVVGFDLISRRPKLIAQNAVRGIHGDSSRDRLIRIYTNQGSQGLGTFRYDEQVAAQLLGKDPFAFYRSTESRFRGPFGPQTTALWDLMGHVLRRPVYDLLGGQGSEQVPVYDGSIYLLDLLPQFQSTWRDRIREEIDMGRADGHVAFKVKIGRGHKWMPRPQGDQRDRDVVELIRAHAGTDVIIGVDANNGYDLARAKQLVPHLASQHVAFAEEMFHEDVDQYRELRACIQDHSARVLIADGENWRQAEDCRPFVENRVVDILQGDMNQFGFEEIMAEAALGQKHGALVAPHNWGSYLGYYLQLHVGRATPNFYRAEHDPLSNDVIIADGFSRAGGMARVPDTPGLGLQINEASFAGIKPRFDLRM